MINKALANKIILDVINQLNKKFQHVSKTGELILRYNKISESNYTWYSRGLKNRDGEIIRDTDIAIDVFREGDIIGVHVVYFNKAVDNILLEIPSKVACIFSNKFLYENNGDLIGEDISIETLTKEQQDMMSNAQSK